MVLHLEGKLELLRMSLIERAGPVTEISTHSIFLCKNFEDEKVDHTVTDIVVATGKEDDIGLSFKFSKLSYR